MVLVKEYLLSLTAAAIVSCILKMIPVGKPTASLIKLLCGVFMACVLIQPVIHLKLDDFSSFDQFYSAEAQTAVAMGEEAAMKKMCEVIKANTETYILDKATTMEVELNVEVTLDGLIPNKVILQGAVSPYTRASLSDWIAQQLGIPREAQIWTVTP